MKAVIYQITSDCLHCGACVDECPVGAVRRTDRGFTIDPGRCRGCGECAGICPGGAIRKTAYRHEPVVNTPHP